MKKPVLAAVIIVGVILGLMAYSMMSLTANRVEVCIKFNGVTSCKIASGATQEDATRTATGNACGELASGVTDTMACLRSEPAKLTVLK